MIQEINRQGLEFLWAGITGAALGLLYDMGRAVRREHRRLTVVVDILFALIFFLSFWLTSVYTRGLRLYQCLGAFLGSAVYFLTVSPLLLGMFRRILRGLGFLMGKTLLPVKKSVYFLRKVVKKFFPSSGKWGTIRAIPFSPKRLSSERVRGNGEISFRGNQADGGGGGHIRRGGHVPRRGGHSRGKRAAGGAEAEL